MRNEINNKTYKYSGNEQNNERLQSTNKQLMNNDNEWITGTSIYAQ
jgi:hypothetical protein